MPRNPLDYRLDVPVPKSLFRAIRKSRLRGESLVACVNRLLAKALKVKHEQRKRGRPHTKTKETEA